MYIFYLYLCECKSVYVHELPALVVMAKKDNSFRMSLNYAPYGFRCECVFLLFQRREREKTETQVMKEKVACVQTRGWTNTNVHT